MENTSFEAENMTRGTAPNTTLQHEDFMSFRIFSLCILFSTIVVGLIGNGLVIFLTGCRMKMTVNSIWFLNLAIADFIFMLASIIDLLSALGQWHLYFMSRILLIMLTLNLFASILFLVVITLDRCLCTWMVVWAKNKRTLLKARIITFTSLTACEFIVGFLIPFLIIASSYIATGVRIKRLKRGKQLRSFQVIITVILSFFICWFPYHVCHIYFITAVNNWSYKVYKTAEIVSICLVHLNSSLNPILYVFMCDEYKKKLKQSLLLVLETAFAEDHLDFKGDAKGHAGQENPTELLDM